MVKRALTLLTSILIALHLLMPFNIYADTAIVMGTDVSLVSTNLLDTDQWTISGGTLTGYFNQFVYHVTVQLDNNYVGYLNLKLNVSYLNRPQSGLHTDTTEVTRKVFINGDKAEFNFEISSWYATDPLLRNTTNSTPNAVIVEQGVTLLSELDSMQQIIDILQEIYNSNDDIEGLLNNQLQQLQLIVSNTSLSNQYLDTLSKLRQFHFPLETYIYQQYFIRQYESKLVNIGNQNIYYDYPVYKLNANDYILNTWYRRNNEFYISFMSDINFSLSNFSSYFQCTNCTLEEIVYSNFDSSTYSMYYKTLKFKADDYLISIKLLSNTVYFMPVYFGDGIGISTDLALQIGIKNEVLKNLNLLANGTNASQSASQSSDSTNSQLQTESNTLFQQENGFKSDMQNAMQNVNNTFRLQDMGSKFVSSAQWVRTQYENLTNNTPFASLITFSLITGLALILLGKVYK